MQVLGGVDEIPEQRARRRAATGAPAKNAELARQRAFAARDALKAAGVAEDKIELKKPEQINAGTAADARRVEVKLE